MAASLAVPPVAPPPTTTTRNYDDLNDIVSEQEFADFMRRGVHSIRRWHVLGVGPARINVNRKIVLYKKSSIIAWLESYESGNRSTARLRVPVRKRKVARNRKAAA